jgi:hypothetical protein
MPAQTPEPGPDEPRRDGGCGPDDQQPPVGAPGPGGRPADATGAAEPQDAGRPAWPLMGGPGWAWVEGSADTGPLPSCDRPGPQPEPPTADGLPAGLDYAALVQALAESGALGSDAEDQDGELAESRAADQEGPLERADMGAVAASAVEFMAAGAAQAGWLEVAAAAVDRLDEHALAGVVIAARQAASRAQAAELAAVAQITARAAGADPRIGLQADGRPARLCLDAIGQVKLALMLTDCSAASWADLAMTLTWRLPATGQALAAGRIDLERAKLIAAATSMLTEAQARAVEAKILPQAPTLTRPYLQERLSLAVIAADPDGAERRRQDAERNADVRLYADDDQTATITGSKLPQIHAAAGFARLTALARARKAAGMPGGLGFHRAQVMLAMMLDTLPYIPPADDAPPDQPPRDPDPGPDPGPAGDHHPDGPVDGSDPGPASDNGSGQASDRGHRGARPDPAKDAGPGQHDVTDGSARGQHAADASDDHDSRDTSDIGPSGHDEGGQRDDVPPPSDEDAPPDDGLGDDVAGSAASQDWDPAEDDDLDGTMPVPPWPPLGTIPPAQARRPADGRPVPGLLDVLLPWSTLAGLSDRPGTLGRIGPITAVQARLLAQAAQNDPAAQWRVIVTDAAGQAITVSRIRRSRRDPATCRSGLAAGRDSPPLPGAGLVGRVTVTITEDTLRASGPPAGPAPPAGPRPPAGPAPPAGPGPPAGPAPPAGPGPPCGPGSAARHDPPSRIARAALRAAARALRRAVARAADDEAAGGCAHLDESPAYRPRLSLREHVVARDVTCRSLVCRQPAWRADLDHSRPYDQHGRTCGCNLGGACRKDHQLKQHPRWKLEQVRPGWFRWTTPAGRTYTTGPDIYPV